MRLYMQLPKYYASGKGKKVGISVKYILSKESKRIKHRQNQLIIYNLEI